MKFEALKIVNDNSSKVRKEKFSGRKVAEF